MDIIITDFLHHYYFFFQVSSNFEESRILSARVDFSQGVKGCNLTVDLENYINPFTTHGPFGEPKTLVAP